MLIESRYDYGKLVPVGDTIDSLGVSVQLQLCRLLQSAPVATWAKGDALRSIIRLFGRSSNETVISACERLLVAVLHGTQLFEHHAAEALVWVHALRDATNEQDVVNFFEKCIVDSNGTWN